MAKKKNSGFSLIEVVIAVAILGLLITPILTQIVQTSNTSRKAKERQAAVENAEYITNFMQRTDKSELDKSSSDGVSDITISNMDSYKNVICTLVDTNGDPITEGGSVKDVLYNAYVYYLDNVKLGPKSSEYTRRAVLDDLSNNVLAEGYSLTYDKSLYTDALKSKGYILTNEGSIVKYNLIGTVKEAVCVKREAAYTDEYVNPNSVSLGFIQDLDSTKVAIIQGIASNFDAQVSEEIFAQKMARLKELDEDLWKTQASRVDGSNIFQNDETGARLLYVSITAAKDGDTIKYYEVKCDVCYYDKYTISDDDGNTLGGGTAKLKYNVFAKKFYTSESPDIYLVYEPYVNDKKNVLYAYNDFIEIYNDADTADSKLYLIRPSGNQPTKYSALKPELYEGDSEYYEGNHYATKYNNSAVPVNINVQAVLKSSETLSTKKVIKTYTNIDRNYSKNGHSQFSYGNELLGSISEFAEDNGLSEFRAMPWNGSSDYKAESYPTGHLLSLNDDTNPADRLFTVTVILESVDGNMDDVRYTAGKGVD